MRQLLLDIRQKRVQNMIMKKREKYEVSSMITWIFHLDIFLGEALKKIQR